MISIFDWDAPSSETGPLFGGECEDLDYTLLQWRNAQGVQEHVNSEVDVIMIVLAGFGEVVLDGTSHAVAAGKAILIPKGAKRAIQSFSDDFRYLNIHKRKRRLMPTGVRGS